MKKNLIILISIVTVFLLASCAKEIKWSSLKPEDAVLTVNGMTYTSDQLHFSYTEEKVAYDIVKEYYDDGSLDFEDYELSMNRVFQDFQCQAVLSALADSEGTGLSEEKAIASAKETYVDSAELMPAFKAYLDKIKEEMNIDDEKLIDYGTLSVKLYSDSSMIAERECSALQSANPDASDEELSKKLAGQLAEITKNITVKNAVTKVKVKPDFTAFAEEYVKTHTK